MRKQLSFVAAISSLALATQAQASDFIWLDSDHSPYSGYYSTGATLAFSGSGVNATASAWSIHGDGNIYQARLGVWDYGLGVSNGWSDNSHTVDNSGYRDFIMLQFDQDVQLEQARFRTGWHGMSDTDATIGYATVGLPYPPPLPLDGLPEGVLSPLNLYESGSWGNSGNSFRNINPSGHSGNIWLVGASFNNPEGSRKLDGFKLEKLTFSVTAVPEPSTWAMLIVGFFGLGGALRASRRKQRTKVSYA